MKCDPGWYERSAKQKYRTYITMVIVFCFWKYKNIFFLYTQTNKIISSSWKGFTNIFMGLVTKCFACSTFFCPARQCTTVHYKHSHSLWSHFGEEGDHPSNINDRYSQFDLLKSSQSLTDSFSRALWVWNTQRLAMATADIKVIIFLSFPFFSRINEIIYSGTSCCCGWQDETR